MAIENCIRGQYPLLPRGSLDLVPSDSLEGSSQRVAGPDLLPRRARRAHPPDPPHPWVFGAFPDYKLTRIVMSERSCSETDPSLAYRIPHFPSPDRGRRGRAGRQRGSRLAHHDGGRPGLRQMCTCSWSSHPGANRDPCGRTQLAGRLLLHRPAVTTPRRPGPSPTRHPHRLRSAGPLRPGRARGPGPTPGSSSGSSEAHPVDRRHRLPGPPGAGPRQELIDWLGRSPPGPGVRAWPTHADRTAAPQPGRPARRSAPGHRFQVRPERHRPRGGLGAPVTGLRLSAGSNQAEPLGGVDRRGGCSPSAP